MGWTSEECGSDNDFFNTGTEAPKRRYSKVRNRWTEEPAPKIDEELVEELFKTTEWTKGSIQEALLIFAEYKEVVIDMDNFDRKRLWDKLCRYDGKVLTSLAEKLDFIP